MKNKIIIFFMFLFLLLSVVSHAADSRVEIAIAGMTCNLCPIAIKKSLAGVDGVREVKISLADKKAWLLVDDKVSAARLLGAINAVGDYKGTIVEGR